MSCTIKQPHADLLPPLSTDEFAALKADIKASGGVDKAIDVDEDGNILDGHHRYKIDKNAKRRVIKGLSDGEKQAYVYRSNFMRRNLSRSQRKEALNKMKAVAKLLRAKPDGKTQQQTADLLGVPRETIRNWEAGSNGQTANTSTQDCRTKVPPKEHEKIAERLDDGEKVKQVAADYGISERQTRTIKTKVKKQAEAKKERKKAVAKLGKNTLGIHHGDFRKIGHIVDDNSVDLIFTDPPYDKEAVPLYADLAEYANGVLRPGGWCLAYAGHSFLPNILAGMSEHLTYGWTFAIKHSGGDLRFRKFKLQNGWKPILGFYKPPLNVWWDWFPDIVSGGKEKDAHPWQQAVSEAEHYIKAMTPPKGLIVDCFAGGGTTHLAAHAARRQCVSFEINEDTVMKARSRIMEAGE